MEEIETRSENLVVILKRNVQFLFLIISCTSTVASAVPGYTRIPLRCNGSGGSVANLDLEWIGKGIIWIVIRNFRNDSPVAYSIARETSCLYHSGPILRPASLAALATFHTSSGRCLQSIDWERPFTGAPEFIKAYAVVIYNCNPHVGPKAT
jgi:hypothetical protein